MALHFIHLSKFICLQIMVQTPEQRRYPHVSSGGKAKSESIGPFKIQKPSSKRENNLIHHTFSHGELNHGQFYGGCKYTISS